jgi:hypothetical protein
MTATDPAVPSRRARNHPRRAKVIGRLLLWLIFGVIIGCLPIFGNLLKLVFSAGGLTMNALLAQGDLFLIGAILSAGAIGEIAFAPLSSRERNYGIAAIGFSLLLCLGNTASYAFTAITATCEKAEEATSEARTESLARAAGPAQRTACDSMTSLAHPGLVTHLSLGLFAVTAVLSAVCIGMAAGRVEG